MNSVIVAFSRPEDGKNIKGILVRNGFNVAAVCTFGAQALAAAQSLSGGVLVCGWQFEDMLWEELLNYLPPAFDMLLLCPPGYFTGQQTGRFIRLPLPLNVHDFLSTLEMQMQAGSRGYSGKKSGPPKRSGEEERLIGEAKALLMERNQMTEPEAYRYMQKCSMDRGMKLSETAQMIISLIHM